MVSDKKEKKKLELELDEEDFEKLQKLKEKYNMDDDSKAIVKIVKESKILEKTN